MTCYYPLVGYRSRHANAATGKRSIVFNPQAGYADMEVQLPCGQCIGCRLEQSRQWAMRCHHEASLYEENAFITLTYDDAHLPHGGTLVKSDFQRFMKRFRKAIAPRKIRFFHCGEYGDESFRPHYHALIFNYDFSDKVLYKEDSNGRLYISEELASYWPFGFSTTGDVTFESAAYVARYVLKKKNGEDAKNHYFSCDPDTGEVFTLEPEYATMSRRPGIGAGWYERYKTDIFPRDVVIMRGKKLRPPQYYDRLLEKEDETTIGRIKGSRKRKAAEHEEDQTIERLTVRETVKLAQIKSLKRTI